MEGGTAIGRRGTSRPARTLGPPAGQWVGIVANLGSGRGTGRRAVAGLTAALAALGIEARTAWSPGEREAIVNDAATDRDCRCLVAVGGDGTVAALVNERPGVPIAVLPNGTENLFARHFRFDRRPTRLAAIIAAGRVEGLDLGVAGGRRFSLMAGIGFDADVVGRHHRARLNSGGIPRPTHRAAYVEPVLRSSFSYRFPEISVVVGTPGEEETIVGTTAFVFNLPRYALGLPFAPAARGDDGALDLVVFREPGAFRALRYLWDVFRGAHLGCEGVHHRQVQAATLLSPGSVPFQLDGDPGGLLEPLGGSLAVEILPGAVDVIVP